MTEYSNRSRRDISFAVGDMVMLSTSNLSLSGSRTRKFAPKFVGPFQVAELVSPVAVRLVLPTRL